jgi:hypothetical protein
MTEPVCFRCGLCCYIELDGKLIKCRYLVQLTKTKTACRIWGRHLGTLVCKDSKGKKYFCAERIVGKRIIDGCPYNDIIKKRITEEINIKNE